MADNFSNTSLAKTNSFNKGMIKDVADIFMTDGVWTNAINAINNSHNGESGTIGNEQSNQHCANATFTIIGYANITNVKWVIFSTNDSMSEIGIFEENTCTYTVVIRDTCLNFKKTNLITAIVKENYDCTYSVYWQDGLNPDRVMNLDRVPYISVPSDPNNPCLPDIVSERLDCDAIRLHPYVTQACVNVFKADGPGQLNNGSYTATIAYSENGIRLTDYMIPSNPQALWVHQGVGGSLRIEVDNLDPDYNEYELVVIATLNQQTVAKKIGYYSTDQKRIVLDVILQSLETVDLSLIPLKTTVYDTSDKMFSINRYLIRSGVKTSTYFNYQPLANQITAKWITVQYPSDYYFSGGNHVGYMRDEVYAFFIRWVYKTGARSASYHIPGRASTPSDLVPITTGTDVLSASKNKKWQVYDTATGPYPTGGVTGDGGVIIEYGQMAYWESIERYPANPTIWGDLCNEPIRHHKMPSNETTGIHNVYGTHINVLSVQFENIKHPLDENGVPIQDIVGYEILRGNREGNRSVVAKGIFNNMGAYAIDGDPEKPGLYQNYPYNDTRSDYFLTTDFNSLDSGGSTDDSLPQTAFTTNTFSFHSVETNFVRPYLGTNYVKIYCEEVGRVRGAYELPYKHPKFKFLTDTSLATSLIIGIGIGLLAGVGTETHTGGQYPWQVIGAATGIATIPAPYFSGSRSSGSSTIATDIVSSEAIQASSVGAVGGALSSIAGIALVAANMAYYTSRGADEVLRILYAASNYRDHVLQYNSHGFYDRSLPIVNSTASGYGVKPSFTRKVEDGMIKYIGSAIQSFDQTFRINNLFRNKFVCLRVTYPFLPLSFTDNTRQRVKDLVNDLNNPGITYKKPFSEFKTATSTYYGAIKVDYENQYGQLQSIVQIPTGSCIYNTEPSLTQTYSTGVIFGGDVYINRYTEKNPYCFFHTWLIDLPNGTEYDYRSYINGPIPRYWMDTSPFTISDINISLGISVSTSPPNISLSSPLVNFTSPSDRHRFDKQAISGIFVLRNAWMYLSYNGVRDFFTESELNMAFRDYGDGDSEKFYDVYGRSYNDLQDMFRSDKIKNGIYYKYDLSLSSGKLFNNFAGWGLLLPRDYDPQLYTSCFEYYPRRVIYSLQQQEGLKRDNWRNFLPLNFRDFGGRVSAIKPLNYTGAIILFENSEPVMFSGIDQLQTEGGVKFTIGDGGLFAQNGQSLVNADDVMEHGTCISSRSAVNTPYGMFYMSQNVGKIFKYSGSGLEDISKSGMKFWLTQNLPSTLLNTYPDYPLYDNPVTGIGCQTIFDPTYEMLYFMKKDFTPVRTDLQFDDPAGVPYYICGATEVPAPTEIPEIVNNLPEYCGCPEGYTLIGEDCVQTTTEDAIETGGPPLQVINGTPQGFFGLRGLRLYQDITSSVYSGTPSYSTWISNLRGMGTSISNGYINSFRVRTGDSNGITNSSYAPSPGTVIYLYNQPTAIPTYEPVNPLTLTYSTSGMPAYPCQEPTSYYAFRTLWQKRLNKTLISTTTANEASFTFCINITEEKQYLIGCAADDEFRLYLDLNDTGERLVLAMNAFFNGIDISNGFISGASSDTGVYNFWHVFPITLPVGNHKLKLYGKNNSGNFGLGAEIYNISLADFATQFYNTAATENDLEPYILFSTRDYQPSCTPCGGVDCVYQYIPDPATTYSCPGGVPVSYCNGLPTCTITDTVPYAPCLDCSLTSSSLIVQQGGSVLLTWTSTGGATVTLNDEVVSANGSVTKIPTTDPTYYVLKVVNGDYIKTCALQVEVTPIPIKCYCNYDNPECFKACDWTLSYDPKSQTWISFHDWHPNLALPSAKHFYTIVDNGIWLHNSRYDSYCNYYGVNHPWEIEYPIVTPNTVTTIRNVEYYMEAYKYYNNGKDYFHILDENFDRAIVYNSEQISGLLKLNRKGKNAPLDLITYPIPGPNGIDILYSKEENKYRFYDFYDITEDRGEFTGDTTPMWITNCSGYQKNINPDYIKWDKPAVEHKKFRHYGNKIILRKNVSNDVKMILKLTNSKHLASIR